MSQSSSSSASPLVLVDGDTKGAPTSTAPTMCGSPCASEGLPPHRFPNRLACIELNTPTFEQGFDEKLVEGGLANHLICRICSFLPRAPATLDACGHLFCERCIKQHFQLRIASQSQSSSAKAAPCPNCRQPFRMCEILTWPAWQRWAQLAFNYSVVKCP